MTLLKLAVVRKLARDSSQSAFCGKLNVDEQDSYVVATSLLCSVVTQKVCVRAEKHVRDGTGCV